MCLISINSIGNTNVIQINDAAMLINIDLESKPTPKRFLLFKNRIQKRLEQNPKATAIALTLTLGPFGMHRIYLGTSFSVPIFYTLTLGGGLGILPLSDLLVIIFTKDISKYYNNTHIFMWDVDE